MNKTKALLRTALESKGIIRHSGTHKKVKIREAPGNKFPGFTTGIFSLEQCTQIECQ